LHAALFLALGTSAKHLFLPANNAKKLQLPFVQVSTLRLVAKAIRREIISGAIYQRCCLLLPRNILIIIAIVHYVQDTERLIQYYYEKQQLKLDALDLDEPRQASPGQARSGVSCGLCRVREGRHRYWMKNSAWRH